MAGSALSDSELEIKKYSVPDQTPDTRFCLFGILEFHTHSPIYAQSPVDIFPKIYGFP
ncbi:hypothetical protein OCU04_004988 [Sclerotinia nivalis]|uniref:Uncharacterized protein n=1 Tax=Sclerotinia nivalis TaxID=352851 RepID=A0A9X0AN62_9HELO|nr:hypothetical protein OCU04_004988 [Sclerotinia nivalis]